MRAFRAALMLVIFVIASVDAAPASAALPEGVMTPAQVVGIDRSLDGSVVELQGEAVGEHIRAHGGGWWINVLGDGTAIGVWATDELAEVVDVFGTYQQNGDIVRVTGIVNVACDQHGGEFDVHASSIAVVEPGGPRDNPVHLWKGAVGLAGLVLALVLWQAHRGRRERRMI